MDIGVAIFPTDTTIGMAELAREVEARGFESLWVAEHTHMPVDHSPHPSGGPLPDEYRRTYDPFVALTVAATATSRLRLGTGICLVAQHDPIDLAKQVASLDHLSGGRLLFGIGYGWNRPETEDHGVPFRARREVLRERVLAAKALWTEEVASFEGDWVRLRPSWMWPKPVQQPHPPILMGAAPGPRTFAHVAEFCDGWMPVGARDLIEGRPALEAAWEAAGRSTPPQLVVYGTTPRPDRLAGLAELGVDRTVLWLPAAPRDEVLRALDELHAVVAAWRGEG